MNILVIEDDKEIREFLVDSLKEDGFAADAAEDGITGARKIRINNYDAVILDIGLPGKNGREICYEARMLGKEMPIIILSIKGEIETKVELFDIGADDYVVKPFLYRELLARIKTVLRRPRKILGDVLRVYDLVLDTKSRSARRGDQEIHLTPKEFFILEYFMRHRGEVLTRQLILEHVWGPEADPFTNTIETHILNLRRKIQINNKPDLIRSVSGSGYKMA